MQYSRGWQHGHHLGDGTAQGAFSASVPFPTTADVVE